MKERLRHLWHEVYFHLAPPSGADFAMTCKHATEKIDLGTVSTPKEWIRLQLHLSLCAACAFYFKFCRLLKRAAIDAITSIHVDVEKLNQELLEKYR